jgi:DHA3 family macrolide efflux protein-like MFS transporter
MQAHVEPERQGRVFTLMNGMAAAMMPISMLIAAPIADLIGIRGWLAVASIGCLVISAAGFLTPDLMNVESSQEKKNASAIHQEVGQDQ